MNRIVFLKKLGLIGPSFFFILLIGFSFVKFKKSDFISENEPIITEQEPNLPLEQKLLNLLSLFVEAHKSLTEQNQDQFLIHIKDILNQISGIDVTDEELITYHERLYLHRQLQNIDENVRLITFESVPVEQKMRNLKQAYKELISISQSYTLNQKSNDEWSVYFCSKNSSLWVQNSSLKKHNPFEQEYQNCGQRIY